MKRPTNLPNYNQVLSELLSRDQEKAFKIIGEHFKPTDSKERYLHWQEIKYREPPKGYTHEEWWTGIKYARKKLSNKTAFIDKSGRSFTFAIPDIVYQNLHWLDLNTAGDITTSSKIINPEMKKDYIFTTLANEPINSSQLEGAATTQRVAKEMLRQGRKPINKSEQMIYNNYVAMNFIREYKNDLLTPEFILELHKILTHGTLDDPEFAGKYRTTDDVSVHDKENKQSLHIPPKATELPERINRICKFANNNKPFIHPVVKAIILHFMLAYDHPFVDGNGRTARALFYWYAVRQGYRVLEYISISQIIRKAVAKYGTAFLFTETDENDLTYFIIHQINVIREAIEELRKHFQKKLKDIESAEKLLVDSPKLRKKINGRQLALVKHALKHPGYRYSIKEHQLSHSVAYDTARKDLLKMSNSLGLLDSVVFSRAFYFIAPRDLEIRLEKFK